MEVRLNNIPKLDEYVIRLVVFNERMLGYIYPDKTSFVVALAVEPGDCVSLLNAINMRRSFFLTINPVWLPNGIL